MTSITTHSPTPWTYDYNPYRLLTAGAIDSELAAFEVFDADQTKIFETNEDMRGDVQEANACLAAAAPEMLEALLLAQRALNTAPRFRVGHTDSYKIAAIVDGAITSSNTRRKP